ncbi:MAG TPA: thioredoxin domain-containing protein [Acidobacteriota bacterium]|nr:thioredoxin domain-containing protein [Acidobacteriota bacterium]
MENTENKTAHKNRLAKEKSPYLLQHADNPVDWYPWSNEAFEKARAENKPVFLSIGYSTCHWCHVMEHESFEDQQVAKLMNDTFVSIKVDREERPDIDNIYMTVCQMLTGSGGWPLTIVMTPDKKPFFAATYIPKEARFGRAGMMELIPRLHDIWINRNADVQKSAEMITTSLQESQSITESREELSKADLDQARLQLYQRFDPYYGGFGSSPKFPTPHQHLFLLRHWKRSGDAKTLEMVTKTLDSMRLGGIYDHLGFGFHRYSTDREWLVPHFEKMLYDQALLTLAYTEAFQATGEQRYKQTAQEILEYVSRDMTSPEGGFYSAEDADSEGEEGKFYFWEADEIRRILGNDAELVIAIVNVSQDGNFVDSVSGEKPGTNILHLKKPLTDIAKEKKMSEQELRDKIEPARKKLFEVREKRIHPYKDDKILTDWNGLMIAAYARAAQAMQNPEYAKAAKKSAKFILEKMKTKDGSLVHRYREGEAGLPAHVDDYAFLTWGLLELYEATFDPVWLKEAMSLNSYLIQHYWDNANGGFYFTSDQSEELITRTKEFYDGAVPSGNSVAMLNLLRLSRISADTELEKKADRIARMFAANVRSTPSAYTMLLAGLDFAIGPSYEIVISGDPSAEDTRAMLKELSARYIPNKVVLLRPEGEQPEISKIAAFTKSQTPLKGKATAYVCLNYVCNTPTTDPAQMLKLLK